MRRVGAANHIREYAFRHEEEATAAYRRQQQRYADMMTLADALEGFWDHPNATDEDKAQLAEALQRLFEVSQ